MASTIDRAGEKLALAVRALGKLGDDVRAAGQLLALLGWQLPPGVDDIGLSQLDVSTVASRLDALVELRSREDATELELAAATAEVVAALAAALDHLRTIGASLQASPEYLSATGIVEQFFPRLADLLVIQLLGSAMPATVPFGALLGVFEFRLLPTDATIFQPRHVRQIVHWERLGSLFSDPGSLLHDVYGWGTADYDGNALVTNIGRVLDHLAVDSALRPLPRAAEEQIAGRAVPQADSDPGAQLFVSLAKGLGFDSFNAGVTLYAVRATAPGGDDGGIGVSPFVSGTTDTSFELSERLSLVLGASAGIESGLALILRAGQEPELLSGLLEPPAGAAPPPAFALALRHSAPAGERQVLFSAPGLQVDAAAIVAGGGASAGSGINPSLSAAIEDGRIKLVPERSDGFLASILPAEGITTTLDLMISWSQRDGVRIHGGAGLRTTIGLHRQVGPLQFDTLDLAFNAAPDELAFTAAVSGAARIGPVTARLESIGAALALRFEQGNLGNADLGVRFEPPNGVGLSIDAAAVSGSGFLFFDPQRGQYAGVMGLTLEGGISLTALGLIATRLPDGGGGFSLLVLVTAEDFKPISLGMGFTLTGIGGLLALNRTFDETVLRAGLKNHTLDSVLFPRDPVRNAPQILSNLNKVFPVAAGHHLFGPMLRLAWGTPTLITADLGVVLEIGARLRLLIVGQLVAILPRPEHDLLRLQMDAVGVLDFDQGTASLDATLYDSRLLKRFVLTGDMALRLKWEGSPNFALAVGGLHPAFNPPANFPRLERIALNLAAGDNPRLRCEAYFALTANTVQFGARAELYAAAAGFSLHGQIGFDVLIQLDPFAFLADFFAQVQLKRGSRNLFKVRVEGSLAGPRPLHVRGKATFEILWWDVSVRFDKTLIEGATPPPPEPVDVLVRLRAALAEPANWTARLPEGQRPMVTLREAPGAPEGVLLHPLGSLTVTQGVVPLDLEISRFGSSTPAGARRFTISGASLGDRAQATRSINQLFAPAQFFEMSDDQKLSRPSFELLAAGVGIGSDAFSFSADAGDWLEVEAIDFETITIDSETGASQVDTENRYVLSAELLGKQASFGAAGSSELRRAGKARYQTTRVAHSLAKEGWSIVATGDLSVQALPDGDAGAPGSYTQAVQALQALKQHDPVRAAGLQILRLSELKDQ